MTSKRHMYLSTLEEIGIYVPELARTGRSLIYFSMIELLYVSDSGTV